MRAQVGVGKGTVTLEDFEKADAIFIFGQNPGTNHPRWAFIREHTVGIEALLDDLRAESWPLLEQKSGMAEEQMRSAGDVYLQAGSVMACWGMGITQHAHSVETIQMIGNLLLMRGHIGRPGAGL